MTNNVGTLMWGTGGCSLTPMPPTFLTSHYVDARLTQGKQGRRKEGKRKESLFECHPSAWLLVWGLSKERTFHIQTGKLPSIHAS